MLEKLPIAERLQGSILYLGAAIALVAGARHSWFGGTSSQEVWAGGLYLIIAGVLVILPNTSRFAFGKDGIVLEQKINQLREQVDTAAGTLRQLSNTPGSAAAVVTDAAGTVATVPKKYAERLKEYGIPVGQDVADPLKTNQFPNTANGYTLSALVEADTEQKNWFNVILRVSCEEPRRDVDVTFFLHPTFPDPVRKCRMSGGIASISLWSYGSFTVIARLDDGTLLELDLAQLPGVPRTFRDN